MNHYVSPCAYSVSTCMNHPLDAFNPPPPRPYVSMFFPLHTHLPVALEWCPPSPRRPSVVVTCRRRQGVVSRSMFSACYDMSDFAFHSVVHWYLLFFPRCIVLLPTNPLTMSSPKFVSLHTPLCIIFSSSFPKCFLTTYLSLALYWFRILVAHLSFLFVLAEVEALSSIK